MSQRTKGNCVCGHSESSHLKDRHGEMRYCKELKPGISVAQVRAVSNDEMCDCKKYVEG